MDDTINKEALAQAMADLDSSDRTDILESVVRVCALFAVAPQIAPFMTDEVKVANFNEYIKVGSMAMTLLIYFADKHGFDINRTVHLVKVAIINAMETEE